MSISPLKALDPACACLTVKTSVANAMEGRIPGFRYLKFFSLGPCSGCASPFPTFFDALNPFTFRSYPGHICFFPAFFGVLEPFTFRSYPGHIRFFPAVFNALKPFTFSSYPRHIRFVPPVFDALESFTFSSYPGHIRLFSMFDGVPRRFNRLCFMVSYRVPAYFLARRRSL